MALCFLDNGKMGKTMGELSLPHSSMATIL